MKCIEEDGSVKCAPALKREKEKSAREYAAEEFKFQTGQYERALRDLIAAAEPVLQEQADIAMGEYATKIDNVLATIAAAKKVLGGEND